MSRKQMAILLNGEPHLPLILEENGDFLLKCQFPDVIIMVTRERMLRMLACDLVSVGILDRGCLGTSVAVRTELELKFALRQPFNRQGSNAGLRRSAQVVRLHHNPRPEPWGKPEFMLCDNGKDYRSRSCCGGEFDRLLCDYVLKIEPLRAVPVSETETRVSQPKEAE